VHDELWLGRRCRQRCPRHVAGHPPALSEPLALTRSVGVPSPNKLVTAASGRDLIHPWVLSAEQRHLWPARASASASAGSVRLTSLAWFAFRASPLSLLCSPLRPCTSMHVAEHIPACTSHLCRAARMLVGVHPPSPLCVLMSVTCVDLMLSDVSLTSMRRRCVVDDVGLTLAGA